MCICYITFNRLFASSSFKCTYHLILEGFLNYPLACSRDKDPGFIPSLNWCSIMFCWLYFCWAWQLQMPVSISIITPELCFLFFVIPPQVDLNVHSLLTFFLLLRYFFVCGYFVFKLPQGTPLTSGLSIWNCSTVEESDWYKSSVISVWHCL